MNTLDVEPSGEAFVSGGDDGLVKVRQCGKTTLPCTRVRQTKINRACFKSHKGTLSLMFFLVRVCTIHQK